MEINDVEKLAKLARMELSEGEKKDLLNDVERILGFIDQIKEAKIEGGMKDAYALRNILREDQNPHESGIHSEKLLNSAPKRKGDHVEVKKIL